MREVILSLYPLKSYWGFILSEGTESIKSIKKESEGSIMLKFWIEYKGSCEIKEVSSITEIVEVIEEKENFLMPYRISILDGEDYLDCIDVGAIPKNYHMDSIMDIILRGFKQTLKDNPFLKGYSVTL